MSSGGLPRMQAQDWKRAAAFEVGTGIGVDGFSFQPSFGFDRGPHEADSSGRVENGSLCGGEKEEQEQDGSLQCKRGSIE